MQDSSVNTLITSTAEEDLDETARFDRDDYSNLLIELNIDFTTTHYYHKVGQMTRTQGWILHLSAVLPQLRPLLEVAIPLLIRSQVPFKIPRDKIIAQGLLNGSFGLKLLGKVVCIYPPTDQEAAELAEVLVDATRNFKGPEIHTDRCLGNITYTRYGAFLPVVINDAKGSPVKYIYDANDELIIDDCPIPFSLPRSKSWPFSHLVEPLVPKKTKLLNARYFPISTIRKSPKGDVLKAIYFKNYLNIGVCVIKEGRSNMLMDNYGRDITDRLQWQFQLDKRLDGAIPAPRVIDCFTENNNAYLAIDFIKGKSISKWLPDIYQGHVWSTLSEDKQKEIIEILLQIIQIVFSLHKRGFVHRDIAPGNFLITKSKKVIPIDLELNWSLDSSAYTPPYLLGTPGHMSPQQERAELPTFADDIYALGTMIMEFCTGLNAIKFPHDFQNCRESLMFLTSNSHISDLVSHCLQDDPAKRPKIEFVHQTLAQCLNSTIHSHIASRIPLKQTPINHKLQWTIQAAINRLGHTTLLCPKDRWVSLMQTDRKTIATGQWSIQYYEGWHTGMSGPLWITALSKSLGYDIETCETPIQQSWDYINNHFFKDPISASPSLFYGGAGISLALSEGLTNELISNDEQSLLKLKACFSSTGIDPSLARGLSGQGIALLHSSKWLKSDFVNDRLSSYISNLISLQRPNGSWNVENAGLDDGISGVLWFLLCYVENNSNVIVENAIQKGLDWLIKARVNQRLWKRLHKPNSYEFWSLGQTSADITLIMIKAFQVFKQSKYKILAEKNLQTIPINIVFNDLTLNGLAKIGELYLEAYKVLGNRQWLDQANWLANFYQHIFIPKSSRDGVWIVSDNEIATADLYTGMSGPLHFLMRYMHQDKIGYPL